MATDLGKVGIVMKGAYNSANTYEALDAVSYGINTYIAKQAVPANTLPTNTTYWQPALDTTNIQPDGLNHNGIYRGKNLGTISTLAQLESFLSEHEVSAGKFTDLYLGDYFTIQDGTYNAVWMIAGFGTEANKGSSNILGSNTLSLIPRTIVTSAPMNSSNTTGVSQNSNNPLYATTQGSETAGYQAYWGSDMSQITLPAIEAKLTSILGTHLKERDILCSTAMASATPSVGYAGLTGASSGWAWKTVKASLMTEIQIFGSTSVSSSFYDIGEGNQKLPIFNFIDSVEFYRAHVWIRAVASLTAFALATYDGAANYNVASFNGGVRPLIVIG